jgi:hypothetical protein
MTMRVREKRERAVREAALEEARRAVHAIRQEYGRRCLRSRNEDRKRGLMMQETAASECERAICALLSISSGE